jgi:hypothetical protein
MRLVRSAAGCTVSHHRQETKIWINRCARGCLKPLALPRAGRLLEATAAIQRTLRGVRGPAMGEDAISQPTDEIIEGAYWVNDSAPDPTQGVAQEPEPGPSTASVRSRSHHRVRPPRHNPLIAPLSGRVRKNLQVRRPQQSAISSLSVNELQRHHRHFGQ